MDEIEGFGMYLGTAERDRLAKSLSRAMLTSVARWRLIEEGDRIIIRSEPINPMEEIDEMG